MKKPSRKWKEFRHLVIACGLISLPAITHADRYGVEESIAENESDAPAWVVNAVFLAGAVWFGVNSSRNHTRALRAESDLAQAKRDAKAAKQPSDVDHLIAMHSTVEELTAAHLRIDSIKEAMNAFLRGEATDDEFVEKLSKLLH